jgi:hypothetical protein
MLGDSNNKVLFCVVTCGGGLPQAGHRQRNQANPPAGGPRQSLTREIHPTPLSQEVPSARTIIAWEQGASVAAQPLQQQNFWCAVFGGL